MDSIFGLKDLSGGLYEVQGYWLTHVTDVVRLPASTASGGNCVVRSQVLLPPGGSGRLAVEVVQKTSTDVLYVGHADVDTTDGSSRQLSTYELPPSSSRVRLRICPHPAGPGTVQAKTSATPAVAAAPAVSVGTGVESKTEVSHPAARERASKEVVENDAATEQPKGPSNGQKPVAPVEDEAEDSQWEYFEEEEEEEPREDDPVVSS